MASEPAAPRRVLIVRLSAIGDVILASGLIPVLRAAWPDAEICWLTEEAQASLLRHHPDLGVLYVLPRARWTQAWRKGQYRAVLTEVRDWLRTLRAARFDLVLDIQGLLKSGLLARLTGAPRRVGLGSKEGSRCLMTEVVSRHVTSHLPGKEYRALCRALGLDDSAYRLNVALTDTDQARAASLLESAGLNGPFAVFCPFTTRPQKHWFDERWIDLAKRYRQAYGQPVAILGGPGDRAHAERLAGAAGAVALAGQTSLTEAAAVIARARVLVGVDTGLTHLGLAMATPTLALFGSTRPYLDPAVPQARVLYEPRDCSPCRRHPTCGGEYSCMRAHEVDKVMAAIRELLA